MVVTLPGAVLPGTFRIFPPANLRAPLRRHDRLRARARHRRRPRRHPVSHPDRTGPGNRHRRHGAAGPLRPGRRNQRHPGPRLRLLDPRRGQGVRHATGTPFTDPASKVQAPAHLTGGYGSSSTTTRPSTASRLWTVSGPHRPRRRRHPPTRRDELPGSGSPASVSISLPVDISNYVMCWRLGQPTHCYTSTRCVRRHVVRGAVAGEKLTTLDAKERALDAEDLLITDGSGAIGIAV